jgi:hypothetical protein
MIISITDIFFFLSILFIWVEIFGFINKHKIYKLNKKLKLINDNLAKNIVFGNKSTLQKISFLSNDKINNQIKINELKNQYKEGRILPLFLCGEEYHNSNRKINFYLNDKYIIYKPNKKTKIKIEFYAHHNYQKKLNGLQNSLGTLPISVKINKDYSSEIFIAIQNFPYLLGKILHHHRFH